MTLSIILIVSLPKIVFAGTNVPETIPELKERFDIRVSAYVYNRTLDQYRGKPDLLAERMDFFGIDDVYLFLSTQPFANDSEFQNEIRALVRALRKRGIDTHHASFSHVNAYGEERNEIIEALRLYQRNSDPEERLAGIHFDIESHIMRENRDRWANVMNEYDLSISWDSQTGYGAGGPNDQVMKWVLEQIEEIKRQTEDLGFVYSQALGHFYEDRLVRGDLSVGGVNDFLEHCDYVILMNYTDDTARLIRQARLEVENANQPNSIEVVVKTADNRVGSLSTTFADKGWLVMMNALTELCEAFSGESAFRGIGFFEFQSLEELWDERPDPLPSTIGRTD